MAWDGGGGSPSWLENGECGVVTGSGWVGLSSGWVVLASTSVEGEQRSMHRGDDGEDGVWCVLFGGGRSGWNGVGAGESGWGCGVAVAGGYGVVGVW